MRLGGTGAIAAALKLPTSPVAGESRVGRARQYRLRATELAEIAEDVAGLETKLVLLNIAESYQHMAAMLDDDAKS